MSTECVVIKIRLYPPADQETCQVELRVEYPDGTDSDAGYGQCRVDPVRHRELVYDAVGTGKMLASGLLSGDIGDRFNEALRYAADARRAARVVLEIPTRRAEVGELGEWHREWHGRRWETLWSEARKRHLTTDEKVYFVRHLPVTNAPRVGLRYPERLRALVAVANPPALAGVPKTTPWIYDPAPGTDRGSRRALHPVRVSDEVARARAALGPLGPVKVLNDDTEPFTLADLVAAIRAVQPHVLYLVAHGILDADGPRLLIGTSNDMAECECPAANLVAALDGLDQLPRLVVLVSCASAGNATGDEGVLAALGPMFAAIGVPVVLAMQGNVGMATAATFLPVFFERLNDDGRIDRAVSVARHHTYLSRCDDFWAPVLFSRLRDARLWLDREPPGRAGLRTDTEERSAEPSFPDDAHARRVKVLAALNNLPCMKNPGTFRRILAEATWYGLEGAAREPGAVDRLADAWLKHADQLGALLEVLDEFEGKDSKPLADLYAAVQEIDQLPVPWARLAELKRIFPPEFVLPAKLRQEYRDHDPAFRPELDFDGRPVIHTWLNRLARVPLAADGGGPLFNFLALLLARNALGELTPAVKKWLGETPAFAWPTVAGTPAAAGMTVVIRRGRLGRFAVRAWVEVNDASTPLTDPAARDHKFDDMKTVIPELVARAAARAGPPADRLRVQVFLPFDLLGLDVDEWMASAESTDTLGQKYRVVVRSYDRVYEDDEAGGLADAWWERWRRRPGAATPLDLKALCTAWSELEKPEFLAGAAAEPPDAADLENLVVTGYPVALIIRGAADGRAKAVVDLALGPPTFDAMSDRVRVARQTAGHPAGPVSLLWDDPDCQPPNIRNVFVQPA